MSRLHLVVIFSLIVSGLFAQERMWKKYAAEAFDDGDYYGAAHFYQKVIDADSANIDFAFKLAESYRRYNAFNKAYFYYQLVYMNDEEKKYTSSLFWMAMINKYNTEYDKSLAQFEEYKKVATVKNDHLYLWTKQEIKSFPILKEILSDTADVAVFNMGDMINTPSAEFAPVIVDDTTLYFSSVRSDSLQEDNEVKEKNYFIKLYEGRKDGDFWLTHQKLDKLNFPYDNAANGTFFDGQELIYSKCDRTHKCKLVSSSKSDTGWTKPEPLPIEINMIGSTNTMPFMHKSNSQEILYFVSDRMGGKGKLDIWYSVKRKGKFSKPKNAGSKVNTKGNETSPFYSSLDTALFFASDWHPGLGGTDIQMSKGELGKFEAPVNLGVPFNSSVNDQYYVTDTSGNGYLSSVRSGSFTEKDDAVCCADIYRFQQIIVEPIDTPEFGSEADVTIRFEKLFKDIPVVLYFHNDRPHPDNWDTLSTFNYLETYNDYKSRVPTYHLEYPKLFKPEDTAKAHNDLDAFFTDYVDYGLYNLSKFSDKVIEYLAEGYSVEVVIKGYASPLAKSNYNVNLSLRRISTFINFLRVHENGVYVPYLDGTAENGAKLTIKKDPYGENTAKDGLSDDYYNPRQSVYGPEESKERRIEVISVKITNDKEEEGYTDKFEKMFVEHGEIDSNFVENTLTLPNTSDESWTVQNVGGDCQCMIVSWDKDVVQPGEALQITYKIDASKSKGQQQRLIYLKKTNYDDHQRIYVDYSVKGSGVKSEDDK